MAMQAMKNRHARLLRGGSYAMALSVALSPGLASGMEAPSDLAAGAPPSLAGMTW